MTRRILVVQPLHPDALAALDARRDVEYSVLTDVSEATLLAAVGGIEALTIRDATLPASVIEAADRLLVVSRHGVGFDNIPVEACTRRGIPVTVVGAANAVSVAEQTMLLILGAARSVVALDHAVRSGDFGARSRLLGVELRGRMLVLVGFGRIGREVAGRAAAFGLRIGIVDPYVTDVPDGAELFGSLDEALPVADVLSLHVPLDNRTRGMIGPRELARMPRGSILVNASRGGLVDEAALVEAVARGHLHGAGLDTFAVEPLPPDSPLLRESRIVLSPHSAALTEQGLRAMSMATVANALAALDGRLDTASVVNPTVITSTATGGGGTR